MSLFSTAGADDSSRWFQQTSERLEEGVRRARLEEGEWPGKLARAQQKMLQNRARHEASRSNLERARILQATGSDSEIQGPMTILQYQWQVGWTAWLKWAEASLARLKEVSPEQAFFRLDTDAFDDVLKTFDEFKGAWDQRRSVVYAEINQALEVGVFQELRQQGARLDVLFREFEEARRRDDRVAGERIKAEADRIMARFNELQMQAQSTSRNRMQPFNTEMQAWIEELKNAKVPSLSGTTALSRDEAPRAPVGVLPRLPDPQPGTPEKNGTYLTVSVLTDRSQDVLALWRTTTRPGGGAWDAFGENRTEKAAFFQGVGFDAQKRTDLIPGLREGRNQVTGFVGQYELSEGEGLRAGACVTGLRSVVDRSAEQRCKEFHWWESSRLCFDALGTAAAEIVDSRTTDENCNRTQTPEKIDVKYERLVGIRFEPVLPGKYLHVQLAPAVGPNPGIFRVSAWMRWDYSAVASTNPNLSLRISVNGSGAGESISNAVLAQGPRVWEFKTEQPGRHELEFSLIDGKGDAPGKVVHVDRATVVVPGGTR